MEARGKGMEAKQQRHEELRRWLIVTRFCEEKEKVTGKGTNGSRESGRQECGDGFRVPHPGILFSADHSLG